MYSRFMTAIDYKSYTAVRTENNILDQAIAHIRDGMQTDNQQSVFLTERIRTLNTYQYVMWILYILVWIVLLFHFVFSINITWTRTSKILFLSVFLLWTVLALPIEYQLYRIYLYVSTMTTGTPYLAPSRDYFPMMSGIKF
jgi:hypothetical protein